MNHHPLNRREFMKLGLFTSGACALSGFRDRLPEGEAPPLHGYGRIAWDWLPVRDRPAYGGNQVGRRYLDQVIPLLEEVVSEEGPSYNPRWYRIVGGYIFSGYIQRVTTRIQRPVRAIDPEGMLAEVTVPYTDSYRYTSGSGWEFLYRLYHNSTHWITSIDEGPDGRPWYAITNDRHRQVYHAPAEHLRIFAPEEIRPISPDVPPEDKKIEISIEAQTLTAYEKDEVVLHTTVATGLPQQGTPDNGIPTDTPFGSFRVSRKMPSRHMGDGDLVSNLTNYELPGVPWVCFFVSTGVALHGAYWHDNFGRRMSHGCVNMRPEEAQWIYRWTTPVGGHNEWYVDDPGTVVRVL